MNAGERGGRYGSSSVVTKSGGQCKTNKQKSRGRSVCSCLGRRCIFFYMFESFLMGFEAAINKVLKDV